MKLLLAAVFLLAPYGILSAQEGNATVSQEDRNGSILERRIQLQRQKEAKYAKEKSFAEGKEYNLSDKTVDPADINAVPTIEPEDDFDMTDVYSDEQ
ncbi:hypothetical protein [Nitratifractor sp.]